MIRSTTVGAAVGAVLILTTSWVAVWASDHVRILAEDRGLLQFALVIPLASMIAAGCVAFLGVLSFSHLLWSSLPVTGLILLGVAALGLGLEVALWAPVLSVALLLPWLGGFLIGRYCRESRSRRRRAVLADPAD